MANKPLIMIVDDEPVNCKLLEQALKDDYESITSIYGNECL